MPDTPRHARERDARRARRRRRGALAIVLVASLPGLAWVVLWAWAQARWDRAFGRAERVTCAAEDVRTAEDGAADVRLVGADGTVVRGRLCEGRPGPRAPGTAYLLLGGVRTGDRAADLFEPPPGAIVLACDWPLFERLPADDPLAKARSLPGLVDGAAESLPAFALALHWLAARPDVGRVVVVGVSLGVPYAAALGPDPAVDGVALLWGGGDVARIVDRALPVEPGFVRRALARALAGLVSPLDPVRHVGLRPDLPLLLVNSADDRRIPLESVRALRAAAPATARVVALSGDHVRPDARGLVGKAVEEVVRWAEESVPARPRGRRAA